MELALSDREHATVLPLEFLVSPQAALAELWTVHAKVALSMVLVMAVLWTALAMAAALVQKTDCE